jgi:hypothetical protein
MGPEDLGSVGDLEWSEFLRDGVDDDVIDDGIDGQGELRLCRGKDDHIDDGLGDCVEEGLDADVSCDRGDRINHA